MENNGIVEKAKTLTATNGNLTLDPNKAGVFIDGVKALESDYVELIKSNPQLGLPLTNIVQKRLLAEKDQEIADLTKALGTKEMVNSKDVTKS